MMKRTVVLFVLLGIVSAGFSQVKLDYTAKPKVEAKGFSAKGLSATSAQFLYQLKQAEATTDRSAKASAYAKLQCEYDLVQGKVSAIVVLASGKTVQDLSAYDVTVGVVSGNLVTVTIPVSRFAELAESGVCSSIDMGGEQHLMLDNVRPNLGIDMIHAGMNLPQGYDGSGVVVGILDDGFQYCHPAFYDATGTTLRVKRVWNQKDSTGTAPTGYGYGSEYTTESQMMAAQTDDRKKSHGSHVASIAAGCGAPYGDGATYKGIAPGADLVFVPVKLNISNVIDAINYVHSYAQSVGKPCVINMSFGSQLGPHDGTDVEDLFIKSLVAQHPDSLVLVTSAGNAGEKQVHLEKSFSPTDTILTTRLLRETYQINDGEVDIWGDRNFSVALALVNFNTGEQVDFTGFFATGADTVIMTNLLTNNNDTLACQFKLSQIDSLNNRYHAYFKVGTTPEEHQLILVVRCDTVATIHAWCDNRTFQTTELVDGTVSGNSHYTVSGFGANTDKVVSVGSYATKLSYTTYTGLFQSGITGQNIGDISIFSSMGPTFDGRAKPDITAPGSEIAAACNRYDSLNGAGVIYDTIVWNGVTEKYYANSGTSMSAPVVTGVIALWMQHNPSLGTDSARAILHSTARNDRYTGNCVSTPNNIWGHGKVNAFGGLPVNTSTWLLNAFSETDVFGCVEGGGVVVEGTHTITAIPSTNHIFVAWEDGVTDNPRTVNITCDTTFIALFSQISYEDCDTIVDFPWTAEFDENFTCWKLIDADGDGTNWAKFPATIASLVTGPSVANLDNWLVSPAIQVNQHLKAQISTRCINALGSQDCSILLSTSGSETADFTTVLGTYTFTSMEEIVFSLPLDNYQGQTVRIAVRHHNCATLAASLFLNDFSIEVVEDSVSVPSYTDAMGYMVTANGLQLNISGAEGHSLEIYDLAGRLVVNSHTADGHYRMPSAGVYILRVNGFKPRKVMVIGR